MKDLSQAAGIPLENRNITNHSDKVTCCTTLSNKGNNKITELRAILQRESQNS
jgi:hypothetical protein